MRLDRRGAPRSRRAVPATAAVVGLVGLELSVLIPLAPTAFPSATSFSGGVAFYVAEAGAGVGFGVIATAAYIFTRSAESEVPAPVW